MNDNIVVDQITILAFATSKADAIRRFKAAKLYPKAYARFNRRAITKGIDSRWTTESRHLIERLSLIEVGIDSYF